MPRATAERYGIYDIIPPQCDALHVMLTYVHGLWRLHAFATCTPVGSETFVGVCIRVPNAS